MPRSQLLSSVLQATALFAISFIICEYLLAKTQTAMEADPNWVALVGASRKPPIPDLPASRRNDTEGRQAVNGHDESSYFSNLLYDVLATAVVACAQFYWHLFLERALPNRPRGKAFAQKSTTNEKIGFGSEEDDAREEAIVQRLLAQGKIRRSSVSWCNIFLKWLLDITVGLAGSAYLHAIILHLVHFHPWKTMLSVESRVIMSIYMASWIGFRPLASLIGFMAVPAHKRMVFAAGLEMVASILMACLSIVVVPWLGALTLALNATNTWDAHATPTPPVREL